MADLGWIGIPDWDRYQHADVTRTEGTPPWIKNYTRLLHDPAYLELSAGERALLHGVWLEFASSRGKVKLSVRWLSRRLNLNVTRRQLESLNHAGFITFSASRMQAGRKQDASASRAGEEKSREEKRVESSRVRSEVREGAIDTTRPDPTESNKDHDEEEWSSEPAGPNGTADGYGPQPLDVESIMAKWKTA